MRGNTRRCQAENPLIALSSFLEPALTEHATIATSAATSPWRGERARDRATSGRGAVDDQGQSETGGSGGTSVAAGERRDRRRPGAAAVRARGSRDRAAASDRAGLGGLGARAETAWGHDDDPLG